MGISFNDILRLDTLHFIILSSPLVNFTSNSNLYDSNVTRSFALSSKRYGNRLFEGFKNFQNSCLNINNVQIKADSPSLMESFLFQIRKNINGYYSSCTKLFTPTWSQDIHNLIQQFNAIKCLHMITNKNLRDYRNDDDDDNSLYLKSKLLFEQVDYFIHKHILPVELEFMIRQYEAEITKALQIWSVLRIEDNNNKESHYRTQILRHQYERSTAFEMLSYHKSKYLDQPLNDTYVPQDTHVPQRSVSESHSFAQIEKQDEIMGSKKQIFQLVHLLMNNTDNHWYFSSSYFISYMCSSSHFISYMCFLYYSPI